MTRSSTASLSKGSAGKTKKKQFILTSIDKTFVGEKRDDLMRIWRDMMKINENPDLPTSLRSPIFANFLGAKLSKFLISFCQINTDARNFIAISCRLSAVRASLCDVFWLWIAVLTDANWKLIIKLHLASKTVSAVWSRIGRFFRGYFRRGIWGCFTFPKKNKLQTSIKLLKTCEIGTLVVNSQCTLSHRLYRKQFTGQNREGLGFGFFFRFSFLQANFLFVSKIIFAKSNEKCVKWIEIQSWIYLNDVNMNMQTIQNAADLVLLYDPLNLYLKPSVSFFRKCSHHSANPPHSRQTSPSQSRFPQMYPPEKPSATSMSWTSYAKWFFLTTSRFSKWVSQITGLLPSR